MAKIYILILMFSTSYLSCKSQALMRNIELNRCKCIYNEKYQTMLCDSTHISPSYAGGIAKLFKFIYDNTDSSIMIKPLKTVKVSFIVIDDGKIDSLKIEQKEGNYNYSEKQLISAIKKSEAYWKSGKCNSEKVATRFKMSFKISKEM